PARWHWSHRRCFVLVTLASLSVVLEEGTVNLNLDMSKNHTFWTAIPFPLNPACSFPFSQRATRLPLFRRSECAELIPGKVDSVRPMAGKAKRCDGIWSS